MNAKISKKDVFLYFKNKLDRDRRRELEAACQSDAQVQRWFEELTPTEQERAQRPRPKVRLDSPAYQDLAALTYLSVERDERVGLVRQWLEGVRNWAEAGKAALASLGEIDARQLLEGVGALLYRAPVPGIVLGAQKSFSVPPPEVPCIYPDYASGRLVIRQRLGQVPSGVVQVLVVRRRGADDLERLPPVRVELERVEPPAGEPYWSAGVSLKAVLGEFQPNDDFIYCVEAVPGA